MTNRDEKIDNYLDGKRDRYGGLTINSLDYSNKIECDDNFKDVVKNSERIWREKRYNGIWIKVDIKQSNWIPILTGLGFIFHHAQEKFVMLTKWLSTTKPCTLPRYPFTTVGVGGIAVNSKGEILLMREKRGTYLGWKFPGGLQDYGEEIEETAIRELKEETGVDTVSEGILCFRHSHQTPYPNCSDIYFIVALRPKDESKIEIVPCPDETAAAGWFNRDEIKLMSGIEIHEFHLKIIDMYDNWKNDKFLTKEVYFVPKLNNNWSLYYLNKRDHKM
uniref:Nudix hydrolase domain-containing protein n=1 Tax=Parastrongyloides trichosuri TaxID=131310 RepID=A0A0N4ZVX8_PARTI